MRDILHKDQEELASMAFEPQNFCTCNINKKLRLEDNSMKYLEYLVFTLEYINCNFFELYECLRTIDIIKSPGEFIYAFHVISSNFQNSLSKRILSPFTLSYKKYAIGWKRDLKQQKDLMYLYQSLRIWIKQLLSIQALPKLIHLQIGMILPSLHVEKQFIVKSVPLEQNQQKISSISSSRQLIRAKVGEYSSFIDGKLLEDIDILKVTEYEDENKSYLIFSTVMKGDLLFEREVVMKSKLSQWLRSQMGQFSMACQTQAHEGIPQSQGIEVEQHHIQEEQQLKVLPKIIKTVKVKKESRKSGKRKE